LISFEEAWKRVSRKIVIISRKKRMEKFAHAPTLGKIKGFTKHEKTFISQLFGDPWRSLSTARTNWNNLVTNSSNKAVRYLSALATTQWQYAEGLISLGTKRLKSLHKEKYDLNKVDYEVSLSEYIRTRKIDNPNFLGPILHFDALILVAQKRIQIIVENKVTNFIFNKEDKTYQLALNGWLNWFNSLSLDPPKEDK